MSRKGNLNHNSFLPLNSVFSPPKESLSESVAGTLIGMDHNFKSRTVKYCPAEIAKVCLFLSKL